MMRALVTGSKGFVGGWMRRELEGAGYEQIDAPAIDVTDRSALREALAEGRPDAVVHLAAIAYAPDAAADPEATFAVAVGGTVNLFEGVRALSHPPVVLVSGSSEVYGVPAPADLPLTESSSLAPATPYALSKAAQESVALAYAARYGITVVITRSFNHTGPGQRPVFLVPALAQRIMAAATGQALDVPVGTVDVRRDICDVRDVVAAYRLLLEAAISGDLPVGGLLVNVCSGRAVSIRWIIDELCRLAGVEPRLRVDPTFVRKHDAPELRGDPALIQRLTGWQATTPLQQTLADIWQATLSSVSVGAS